MSTNSTSTWRHHLLLVLAAACALVSAAVVMLSISDRKIPTCPKAFAGHTTEELRLQFLAKERKIKNERSLHQELKKTLRQLDDTATLLPDRTDTYAWATDLVWRHARKHHIEITTMGELYKPLPPNSPYQPYAVRVAFNSGYFEARDFVASLEIENPYLQITQLDIESREDDPENHAFTILLEWVQKLRIERI